MARVLCINDFFMYSEMMALFLEKKGGHEVKVLLVPFDLREVRDFDPDVILASLVRKTEALGTPIHDFYAQVDGARALRTIEDMPEFRDYPLIVTAMALVESELPDGLEYMAFVEVPNRLDHLLRIIGQLAKSRGHVVAPD